MKTLLCLFVLAAIALAIPADTDVSGKWTGTMTRTGPEASGESSPAMLVLKQAGGEITGTAGPNDGEQFPLKKGTIAGDKVTLEIEPRENQSIKLQLVLSGEKMTGEITMSRDGQSRTGKLEVARTK
jgi:hypothetical protein